MAHWARASLAASPRRARVGSLQLQSVPHGVLRDTSYAQRGPCASTPPAVLQHPVAPPPASRAAWGAASHPRRRERAKRS